jgi:hypothetical protein
LIKPFSARKRKIPRTEKRAKPILDLSGKDKSRYAAELESEAAILPDD